MADPVEEPARKKTPRFVAVPSEDEEDEQPEEEQESKEEEQDEQVVPAPVLKTESTANTDEEKAVRKRKVSEAVLAHCARMRELRKTKPKEVSVAQRKAKAREIKREVEKKEAEKIDQLYEEVVVKPKQKQQIAAPKPVAAPPAFKDILDVKSYYKNKYKTKYGKAPPPEREHHKPEYDRRKLLRRAMDSIEFFSFF